MLLGACEIALLYRQPAQVQMRLGALGMNVLGDAILGDRLLDSGTLLRRNLLRRDRCHQASRLEPYRSVRIPHQGQR